MSHKIKIKALWLQPEIVTPGNTGYIGVILSDGTPAALCSLSRWRLLGPEARRNNGWTDNVRICNDQLYSVSSEEELRTEGLRIGQPSEMKVPDALKHLVAGYQSPKTTTMKNIRIRLTEFLKHNNMRVIIGAQEAINKASVSIMKHNMATRGKTTFQSLAFYYEIKDGIVTLVREYYADDADIPLPVHARFLDFNTRLREVLATYDLAYEMEDF